MIYVNLLVGAAGTVVYGFWASKWATRRAWRLAFMNGFIAAIIAAFVLGFAILANNPLAEPQVGPGLFRYLLPFAIGIPVFTRWWEFERDEQREEYAKKALSTLRGRSRGRV